MAKQHHPFRVLVAFEWYDHELHSGVAQYAREAGWVLDNWMVHYGEIPAHWRGDGMIALVVNPRGDVVRFSRQWHRPIVANWHGLTGTMVWTKWHGKMTKSHGRWERQAISLIINIP